MPEITDEKMAELVAKFKEFIRERYYKELVKASNENTALVVDFNKMEKFNPEFCAWLVEDPETMFKVSAEAVRQIDMGPQEETESVSEGEEKEPEYVAVRFAGLPEIINIRDIRAKQLGRFIATEGIVRRASEIRPEIMETEWECMECGSISSQEIKGSFVMKPFQCSCGGRSFKQAGKKMIDARWITIEEPFELTEGEQPSQLTIFLTRDLVAKDKRSMTDPGNRLRMCGVLRDIPKGKFNSAKLDFFLDANSLEPTEIGWEKVEASKEDEEEIKKLAMDPNIYEKFVGSLAPSIYGYPEIKESIILQMFSGVPRVFKDKMKLRGEIHILMIGDPASGKCVAGDTKVILGNGETKTIKEIVESNMQGASQTIDDGFFAKGCCNLFSLSLDGKSHETKADIFWKRKSPKKLIVVETQNGKSITVTPEHPFFVCSDGFIVSKPASELTEHDYIASPRRIPIKGSTQKIGIAVRKSASNNPKHMIVPAETSPELCRFIAYVLAEGYVRKKNGSHIVWFTNNSPELLDDFEHCAGIFSLPVHRRMPHKGKNAVDAYISSVELVDFLEKLEPALLRKSRNKRIPDIIMKASDEEVLAFLRAFFDSESSISETEIELSSASMEMLEQIQVLLSRFGIISSTNRMKKCATNSKNPVLKEYYRLAITGSDIERFKRIGFSAREKLQMLASLQPKISISDVTPNLSWTLEELRKAMLMTQFDMGVARTSYQHLERGDRNPTKGTLLDVVSAFENRLESIRYAREGIANADWNTLKVYRNMLHLPQTLFSNDGLSQSMVSQYENGICGSAVIKPKVKNTSTAIQKAKTVLHEVCNVICDNEDITQRIMLLRDLAESDIFWDKIDTIRWIDSEDEWIYDMQVPRTHNFVANQMFVHNSQLLKIVPNMIPRGRYVSGKGVTSAGLTATVTKDEQFMGGWVLEAGAMVLSNKGMLAIDEFEKMDESDQVAMHEALEQGSVSIAKASIVATLPAQTSVLAGGNPKFSRFDTYRSITEQINIPDTLLSRFDLKFALRDVPNAETDKLIVDHVLKAREGDESGIAPVIDPMMVRKYISYAKKNCKPKLTKETGKLLKDYYIKTRRKAEGGNAPIPITLRQFESLIRLAEASAKIQLSDVVRKEDAQRAIRLMEFSLMQLGYDVATGRIDVDKSEGATSFTERSRIRLLIEIINNLSAAKKEIALKELYEAARKEGMPEQDLDSLVEKLKREGMLFEPNPGFVQKV